MEVRYTILQRGEATFPLLNRTLLINTENKSSIIFSIKNLMQDKRKSIENIYMNIGWEIISQLLNVPNIPRC